jgi:hypothetical protein
MRCNALLGYDMTARIHGMGGSASLSCFLGMYIVRCDR